MFLEGPSEPSWENEADKTASYTRDPPTPQSHERGSPSEPMPACYGQWPHFVSSAFFGQGRPWVAPSDSGFDARYHLCCGDVRVNSTQNPLWMEIHIKQSKCDQFAEGIKIAIGATGSDLCPVEAMLGFLVQRGCAPGALFLFKDGRLLTRTRFVLALRSALAESGIDSSFACICLPLCLFAVAVLELGKGGSMRGGCM